MKKYPSIVSNDLIAIFPTPFPLDYSLPNFVSNCVGLESILACAGLFCPEIIEIDGVIYRCENNNGKIEPYDGYGKDKRTLEMVNNVFSFNDFFLSTITDAASDNEVLMTEFSNVLKYFWGIRLKSLYPNKTFEFIITDDGLYGEEGFCMTFYEVE
ncbi:hypothetical protein KDV41_15290 [Providencia stuartii]|nr:MULTISPECIES: hypothetical protein [Providencia]AVE43905.1 hypothetical protein AM353_19780 [Providencia stuartii]MBN5558198.1 hypothetical protein [Providencia stuartii]MBQ0458148.1 hypothetical protein [Providencia stuartii]MBQ0693934.1 hypothetical protein [Providencia stuartii]MDN7225075.1 hypothetical protein [Providencia stuartii]